MHGLRRARLVRRKPVFQGRKDGKHVFVALAEEAFLLFLGAVQDDADRKKILVIVFLAEVIIKNDSILFLGLLDSQIFDLQGRRVSEMKRGSIYIQNGRKIIK